MSLLFLTFCLGIGAALTLPAWQAIQPELVPRAEFPQAIALGALTFNLGRAVGPALGGVVVAVAGPPWVFLINAVSFLAVVGVLLWWRRDVPVSTLPAETMAGAIRAGMRYGANSSALRHVLDPRRGVRAAGRRGAQPAAGVARDRLGLGSGGYGLLLAAFGIGAALAAVLRPRIDAVLTPDRMLERGHDRDHRPAPGRRPRRQPVGRRGCAVLRRWGVDADLHDDERRRAVGAAGLGAGRGAWGCSAW